MPTIYTAEEINAKLAIITNATELVNTKIEQLFNITRLINEKATSNYNELFTMTSDVRNMVTFVIDENKKIIQSNDSQERLKRVMQK
jgi:hypothetical protein